jgi:general secretion pathway protein F
MAFKFPLRLFSHELSVLLAAGITLLEAVQTLAEKEEQALVAQSLHNVVEGLNQGLAFSATLAAQPQCFDTLFVTVVASAERTGQLQLALAAHARYLMWVQDLQRKLLNASIYPAMLLGAGTLVLLFLLVFVVPRFAGLLEGTGRALPAASQALINLGKFTGAHGWLTVAVGLGLLALPVLVLQRPAVRAAVLARLWLLPVLGAKLRLLALARLYRTLGMLLGAGVPLVPALATTQMAVAMALQPGVAQACEAVRTGVRLASALEAAALTTPVALRMVRVGERSGQLGAMLEQAAAFYDEELSRLAEVVTSLINPVLMLVMGLLIGGVVVLMYMPIFQLVEQLQ